MKYKHLLKEAIYIIFGTFILVVSVRYFILPFNILSGGIAGIAVTLSPIIHLPKDVIANFLIIFMFLLGAMFLGKEFIIKTAFSSILYPVFLSILMRYPITLHIDPILASVYSGVLAGLGVGIVFRVNASTGGMDVPVLILNKLLKIPMHTLVLIIDAITVSLGFMVFGIESVLLGLISVYACSIVIDKILVFGGSKAISLHIISDNYEEISNMIHDELDRGSTLLEGFGGYTKKERPVLLCAIDAKEYPFMIERVGEIDKEAFIIANEANEVRGNGFYSDYRV